MTNQQKINCGCGSIYSLNNKLRHYNTTKHKEHESFLQSVDAEWEANTTPKLELKLTKFIREYNVIAELKLKNIICRKYG